MCLKRGLGDFLQRPHWWLDCKWGFKSSNFRLLNNRGTCEGVQNVISGMPMITQILDWKKHVSKLSSNTLLLILKCLYDTKWIVATWPHLMLMKSGESPRNLRGNPLPMLLFHVLWGNNTYWPETRWVNTGRGEGWLVSLNRSCIHGPRQVAIFPQSI